MNVLLITVDSLRFDRIGRNGYRRNTTPFLDELADEAVFFERAYSPSSHTREAVPSILTGVYPSHAVTRSYRISKLTVARLLSDEGYETGAFLSGPFFTARRGYTDGFDIFDSEYSGYFLPMVAQYWWKILTNGQFRDGYDLNDSVLSFAEDADEPFFAWGHYMDVHAPYTKCGKKRFDDCVGDREAQATFRKAKHTSFATEDDRSTLIDLYDNSVRYFDGVMRDLFEGLDDAGVLDNTVVFVTSDHGESFGEDGKYEHGKALSPELLRVPLWLHEPDGGGETVEKPVSTVDILPTVAEMADLTVDCDGVPLLGGETDRLRDIKASQYGYLRREREEKDLLRV